MRLKVWIVCTFTLGAVLVIGCGELSGDTLAGTSAGETQALARSRTNPPIADTPTSAATTQPSTSSPEPLPTEMPAFKLPEGGEPGWLLAVPPRAAGTAQMAFMADGKTIASAFERRIDFYDMQSGELINTLSYKTAIGITDFVLIPDGSELVVASQGRIDVWNIAAKTFRILVRDPTFYQFGTYETVKLSPDGALLATGPTYPSIEFSNTNTAGHEWRIRYAEIWETKTWARKLVLKNALAVCSFSPDGKSLATLSGGGLEALDAPGPPVIWDMITGVRRELAVDGYPTSIAYAPDGTMLAINTSKRVVGQPAGISGTLLLDTTTGQVQRTITNSNLPLDISFSPDGKLLAVLYDNDQIVLWNIETGEQSLVLSDFGKLRQPTFSPDGALLTAVSPDGRIMFWNVPSH